MQMRGAILRAARAVMAAVLPHQRIRAQPADATVPDSSLTNGNNVVTTVDVKTVHGGSRNDTVNVLENFLNSKQVIDLGTGMAAERERAGCTMIGYDRRRGQ